MDSEGAITLLDDAKHTLSKLAELVNTSSRLTRSELQTTLGKIYAIQLAEADRFELIKYIRTQRATEGANRVFVMEKSNTYVLLLRYVFPSVRDRSNVSRYAGALSEMKLRNIPPSSFTKALKEHGGITDLYWLSRDRINKFMTRSKITLDRNIKVQSGKLVTLQLVPKANGVFEVLSCVQEPTPLTT